MQALDQRRRPQAEASEADAVIHRSLRWHLVAVAALSLILVVGLGGWAVTTELSSAVIAPGRVIIEGNAKDVQHLSGGVVSEIVVREGDEVSAGDILLRLDPTMARANLSILNSALARFYARRARLLAEIKNQQNFEPPVAIFGLVSATAADDIVASERGIFESGRNVINGSRDQLQTRKRQLFDEAKGLAYQTAAISEQAELIAQEVEKSASLFEKKIITLQRFNLLKRQRADLAGQLGQLVAAKSQAEGRASEIELQIVQLDKDRVGEISKDLTVVDANIAEYEDRRAATSDQLNRLEVRSPVRGRVYQIAVQNIGAVVQPGQTLMKVVPDQQNFHVEVRLAPKDIDQVHAEQDAEVRFTAFNSSTTPDIAARVFFVAPDLQTDPRTGEAYYLLKLDINLAKANLSGKSLYPGMPAEVFIKISDRNVASYFTKPFKDRFEKVFREQ